ncbi:excinuclease ABC subunit UvrC [Sandarakinorhabdus rubra]|uniref:excinuclease ABC subunit UvrC n=1 Tax=Sandarakinorhabdus rubra TaxID=2672568 RepID=UPI0013DB2FC0|nr:excinuclease ABC subunit UvrC [Sandarakinorhabdus rubra]
MSEPPPTPAPDRFSEETQTYTVRGKEAPDLELGVETIRRVVKTLPLRPGVYRMLDAGGEVLYVGKARTLKNRVTNYTQVARLPRRLQRMVAQTRSMEIVTTGSEAEALLLEAQLIKRYRPPYNVLLRDDKSFPFILLREDHDFPRISKHRGARVAKGSYYGPFASAGAVNATLNALQKVFLLRSCTDSFFANRDRPCLLYQIKRCSAPCVGRIDEAAYAELVADAMGFLSGRTQEAQKKLAGAMQAAAEAMDFERAAVLRDRLRALTFIQGSQAINAAQGSGAATSEADVVAMASDGGAVCVQIFFIRGGQNWGHRSFFPGHTDGVDAAEILQSFLGQLYADLPPPRELLLDRALPEADLLAAALSERAGRKVAIRHAQRGPAKRLVEQAQRNAEEAIERRRAETTTQARLHRELAEIFELDGPPQRIEIYDNSHIMGTNALGAMVVAGPEGFQKGQYRKFNMKDESITPGDDFAMMKAMLHRRFARLEAEDPDRESGTWPDLCLIDGGKGQVAAVMAALAELGVEIPVVGVAKGPDRNAGRETFHLPSGRELTLQPNAPVMFYLQRLRDEAHRFAIGAHRAKRAKSLTQSPLDEVPGIGPARKKALLMHFGTSRAVKGATLADLERAPGISKQMALAIWQHFHPAG